MFNIHTLAHSSLSLVKQNRRYLSPDARYSYPRQLQPGRVDVSPHHRHLPLPLQRHGQQRAGLIDRKMPQDTSSPAVRCPFSPSMEKWMRESAGFAISTLPWLRDDTITDLLSG